jgi:hypothetical protein
VKRRLAWIAAAAGLLLGGAWYLSPPTRCAEEIREEYRTPDGAWTLRTLLSRCGEFRGTTEAVAIRRTGDPWWSGPRGLTDSGLVLVFAKDLPLSHRFEGDTLVFSCSGCTSAPLYWRRVAGLPFVLRVVDSSGTVLQRP